MIEPEANTGEYQYQDQVMELLECVPEFSIWINGPPRPGLNRESLPVEWHMTFDPIKAQRTALSESYKRECRKAGVKVNDTMVAKAANPKWHDRTQVMWWKRNDPRSTPAADRMIRAVFKNKPHLGGSSSK
jgi:hypothetical protein